VKAADHDRDGILDDVDVFNEKGRLAYTNAYSVLPWRSRKVTNKKNRAKALMEFYEQHPSRKSRYQVDRAKWNRNYLDKELSPYQILTGIVSSIAKTDPRFTNAGSEGNAIRMKMAGIIWNRRVLPRCFPQYGPDYPWKQDPQAYRTREEFLPILNQAMDQRIVEIGRDIKGYWETAYQQAAREVNAGVTRTSWMPAQTYIAPPVYQANVQSQAPLYSQQQFNDFNQYAVNYNNAARQGRAIPENQYLVADENDPRVGVTDEDDNEDDGYMRLRNRAKNRREQQRERDREAERGGGNGRSRAFPAGPLRTASGKKWKILHNDD
jgi:hypothetical protein